MATTITRTELRTHYRTIASAIENDGLTPDQRTAALESLRHIGNVLANLLPPDGPVAIQEVLFDVPEKRGGY